MTRHAIFRRAVSKRRGRTRIDVFAIDCNGIIHEMYAKFLLNGEGTYIDVYKAVYEELMRLMRIVGPRTMIVAIDGVAPQAKINQQRMRRYMSRPEGDYDRNEITPGTRFMFNLDAYLKRRWRKERLQGRVIYSSHLEFGEGEHKIIDIAQRFRLDGNLMVWGADSDLFMIYLLQVGKWKSITMWRHVEDRPDLYIDIVYLARLIEREFKTRNSSADFVVLMALLGNDFLPHFPPFNLTHETLDSLLESYIEFSRGAARGLVGREFNWGIIMEFMNYFTENVYERLLLKWATDPRAKVLKQSIVVKKNSKIVGRKTRLDLEGFAEDWYKNLYAPGRYRRGDEIRVTNDDKIRVIDSYLTGLYWVYRYYSHDGPLNFTWYYPYHYTPNFPDIPLVLEMKKWRGYMDEVNFGRGLEIGPLEQLAMVIPPTSLNALPSEILPLYQEDSTIYDIYPEGFLIDDEGKVVDYIREAILPIPSRDRVIDAVRNLGLREGFEREYKIVERSEVYKGNSQSDESYGRGRGRGGSLSGRGRGDSQSTRGRGGSSRGRGRGSFRGRGRGESARGSFRGRGRTRE